MNTTTTPERGWTVHIDAASRKRLRNPDKLTGLLDQLAAMSPALSYDDQTGLRWSITLSAYDVDDAVSAIVTAQVHLELAARDLKLPAYDVVAVEAMTFAEHDRRLEEPAFPELLGAAEVTELLGVSRQRLSELRGREGFPAPVAVLASGPVYTEPSLRRFVDSWDRKPGRRKVTADA